MNVKSIWKRVITDIKDYYIAVFLLILVNIVVRKVFHAFCPFLIITGFPCAGCGMTRAVYHILTGNFSRGINLNPAAPFWIGWILYFGVNRYVLGKNSKWLMRLLTVVCVITFMIYLYRMLTQFPSDPPLTYYKNNILSKYSTIMLELLQYVEML